jgi:hypothetical protein
VFHLHHGWHIVWLWLPSTPAHGLPAIPTSSNVHRGLIGFWLIHIIKDILGEIGDELNYAGATLSRDEIQLGHTHETVKCHGTLELPTEA